MYNNQKEINMKIFRGKLKKRPYDVKNSMKSEDADPMGSYTGVTDDEDCEIPVQDADDL